MTLNLLKYISKGNIFGLQCNSEIILVVIDCFITKLLKYLELKLNFILIRKDNYTFGSRMLRVRVRVLTLTASFCCELVCSQSFFWH